MFERHMFKKVEMWVVYLTLFLGIILSICLGILVRQELVGGIKMGAISRGALFLSEIPSNLRMMVRDSFLLGDRFPNLKGFEGENLKKERYLLLSRYDGIGREGVAELVDLRNFEVLHTWNPDVDSFNETVDQTTGEFRYLFRDYGNDRYLMSDPILTHDSGLLINGIARKLDLCSKLVWQNQENMYHHSMEEGEEGSFWLPARLVPSPLPGNKFGNSGVYVDDAIVNISPDGEVLFEKSVSELLIENGLEYLLFSVGDRRFTQDPIHLNDIQPVLESSQFWKKGDLFLSLRHQSMVLLYRPSINKVIWTSAGRWFHQHDVDILDGSRISIFNNNSKDFHNADVVDGHNEVVIFDFELDKYKSYNAGSLVSSDVRTVTGGGATLTEDGDLFVIESDYGRLLYFDADGKLLWSYVNRESKQGKKFAIALSRLLHTETDLKRVRDLMMMKEEVSCEV